MQSQPVSYAPVLLPALPPVIYQAHQLDWQDAIRADFLRRLDSAPGLLSDWELGFLENNIGRTCYTVRQRGVIDRLRLKYNSSVCPLNVPTSHNSSLDLADFS